MGRRSAVKRVVLALGGIKNRFVRLGNSMEKGINSWAKKAAGPQLTQEIESRLDDQTGPM
jgi:hypothetical protein